MRENERVERRGKGREEREERERERRGPEGEAKPNRAATKLAIRSFWVHKSWLCSDTVLECREKEREGKKTSFAIQRNGFFSYEFVSKREREREREFW